MQWLGILMANKISCVIDQLRYILCETGRKGTAYTFISSDEEAYAPDLVKALEDAKQDVPKELINLNEAFLRKVFNLYLSKGANSIR